jgi:hypothetical protein
MSLDDIMKANALLDMKAHMEAEAYKKIQK